jgi:phage terminase Nu1 subunit (DNA packaging protein)
MHPSRSIPAFRLNAERAARVETSEEAKAAEKRALANARRREARAKKRLAAAQADVRKIETHQT